MEWPDGKQRCCWANPANPRYVAYHDDEWGVPVHDDGLVYFFSMATSFTKAALGAEGIGKDVTMIIGNGYTKNHAQITLDVLRENPKLRKLFDEKYC